MRLLESWWKRLRIRSSCLSSSGARPRDAIFAVARGGVERLDGCL